MSRILFVNDEEDLLEISRMVLESAGHEVSVLTVADEIVTVAAYERPQVIVLDFVVGIVDSEQAARMLRRDPRTASIPILMSATLHDIQQRIGLVGVDAVLNKPYTASELLNAVARLSGEDERGRSTGVSG
jgi:two-component system, OmpR family, phosphate regulon response regulator PhoB